MSRVLTQEGENPSIMAVVVLLLMMIIDGDGDDGDGDDGDGDGDDDGDNKSSDEMSPDRPWDEYAAGQQKMLTNKNQKKT